jgi:hypothetical protein
MSSYPFQRLLVVNSQPVPDAALLRYAAGLKSTSPGAEVLIASAAGERVMRDLAPLTRAVLGAGDTPISFRVLLEPHLDLLFDLAVEAQSDLIIARHPRGSNEARLIVRQLLFEAPCAVCLVPEGARACVRRPLVRLEPTSRGARLLGVASAIARHARSEELIALHTYFHEGLDAEPDTVHQRRRERELDLYRFLARADLAGVNCTPLLEENPSQTRSLIRNAETRQADLLVFDPAVDQMPVWQWNRRKSESLARSARIPVLSARFGGASNKVLRTLRERVFTEMEVSFN